MISRFHDRWKVIIKKHFSTFSKIKLQFQKTDLYFSSCKIKFRVKIGYSKNNTNTFTIATASTAQSKRNGNSKKKKKRSKKKKKKKRNSDRVARGRTHPDINREGHRLALRNRRWRRRLAFSLSFSSNRGWPPSSRSLSLFLYSLLEYRSHFQVTPNACASTPPSLFLFPRE